MSKQFSITRVVTKDFITDKFQGIRNLFGLRLRGYEGKINETCNQLIEEVHESYDVDWWRLSVNPLVTGAIMITIYGETR